jgi:peptidoglycan/LPS O-acetylase OafA/YrhL
VHRLLGLDLVRFGAAALVMMFHLAVVSWNIPKLSPNYGVSGAPQYPELAFLSVGWVGVEIFFVLSGLVIAQSANGKSAFRFLRSRLGRLLPAVYVCSTITLIVVLAFEMDAPETAIPNYFRSLIIHRNGPWISGLYWTLSVETFFYAMIFLLLWFDAFRHIGKFAILLGIYSSVYLIGVSYFGWHRISAHFLGQHGCFFSLGILIWLCSELGITFIRLLFCVAFLASGILEICTIGNGILTGYSLWAAPAVWLVSVVAILIALFSGKEGTRLTGQLGLMTYPLYLVHDQFGSGILRLSNWTGKYFALGLAAAAVLVLSWVIVQVEAPIRRLIELSLDWLEEDLIPTWLIRSLARSGAKI